MGHRLRSRFQHRGLGGASRALALPQRSAESIQNTALASAGLAHQLAKGHLRLRAGVLAISAASSRDEEQTSMYKLSLMVLRFHRDCHDNGLAAAR